MATFPARSGTFPLAREWLKNPTKTYPIHVRNFNYGLVVRAMNTFMIRFFIILSGLLRKVSTVVRRNKNDEAVVHSNVERLGLP